MTCNLMNHEQELKSSFNTVCDSTTGNEWYELRGVVCSWGIRVHL